MLVNKITLRKWTVHFEVNHRQSHTPRKIFTADNMNRSSVVTKTKNVHNTMMQWENISPPGHQGLHVVGNGFHIRLMKVQCEAGWPQEAVWLQCKSEKFLTCWESNPSPNHQLVMLMIVVPCFPQWISLYKLINYHHHSNVCFTHLVLSQDTKPTEL